MGNADHGAGKAGIIIAENRDFSRFLKIKLKINVFLLIRSVKHTQKFQFP